MAHTVQHKRMNKRGSSTNQDIENGAAVFDVEAAANPHNFSSSKVSSDGSRDSSEEIPVNTMLLFLEAAAAAAMASLVGL